MDQRETIKELRVVEQSLPTNGNPALCPSQFESVVNFLLSLNPLCKRLPSQSGAQHPSCSKVDLGFDSCQNKKGMRSPREEARRGDGRIKKSLGRTKDESRGRKTVREESSRDAG